MNNQVFAQTTIAVVWDFDKTLIPGYMQAPLFEHFSVEGAAFWGEVNSLADVYRGGGVARMTSEIHYLNHILDYVADGRFADLNNALLRELGAQLEFYPGIPELFGLLNAEVTSNRLFNRHGISIEHYVVSTGLREMILGSAIADHIEDVWGCELFEQDGRLSKLGYILDNTSKTRALFEINKGANKHREIDVNSAMGDDERRIPFANMIYLADGPSDVPVFSLLNRNNGHTFGVYRTSDKREYQQIHGLQQQGRVQGSGPADYREGSPTFLWLTTKIEEIANRIAANRDRALGESLGAPPQHLTE
ncbi:MAG: HAD family hydrolase [Pseudomonadota bacterium]